MQGSDIRSRPARTAAVPVLLTLLALTEAVSAAPRVKISRATFPLHATSEAGLLAELRARGPLVGGRRTFARTRMKSSLTTRFAKSGGTCRVRRVRVVVGYTMLLPRAVHARRFPPPMRRRWRAFLKHLTWHENRHAAIWTGCARTAERRIRKLSAPDCDILKERTRAVWKREMRLCDRLHDAFDEEERRAALRLPFLRSALGLKRHARRRAVK